MQALTGKNLRQKRTRVMQWCWRTLVFIGALLACHEVCRLLHQRLAALACQYRNGRIYECPHRQLADAGQIRRPPAGSRLAALDLSHNRLTSLDVDFLAGEFPSVSRLDAGFNLISRVAYTRGVGWPELREVRLSGNSLAGRLNRSLLGFAPGLTEVWLSANQIEGLAGAAFGLCCRNLTRLELAENRITELAADEFWGLWSLSSLSLARNQIHTIGPDTFLHLASLGRLDLSGNRLRALPAASLRGLSRLAELLLAGNLLASLPEELAFSAPGLRHLDMSANQLSALFAQSVANLAQLDTVLLNATPSLLLVDAAAFDSLPRLRLLDLSDCPRLRFLSAEAARDCPELRASGDGGGLRVYRCPLLLTGQSRSDSLQERELPQAAAVRVVDLFPPVIHLPEGHHLRLPCRSTPQEGRAVWRLPKRVADAAELRGVHVKVTEDQTLLLRDARVGLSGEYRCCVVPAADNAPVRAGTGRSSDGEEMAGAVASRTVRIVVTKVPARLELIEFSDSSLTVALRDFRSTAAAIGQAGGGGDGGFALLYAANSPRQSNWHPLAQARVLPLVSPRAPLAVVARGLRPRRAYRVCLARRTLFIGYQALHCILASTSAAAADSGDSAESADSPDEQRNWRRQQLAVIAGAAAVAAFAAAAAVAGCSCRQWRPERRRRRRRCQRDPRGAVGCWFENHSALRLHLLRLHVAAAEAAAGEDDEANADHCGCGCRFRGPGDAAELAPMLLQMQPLTAHAACTCGIAVAPSDKEETSG